MKGDGDAPLSWKVAQGVETRLDPANVYVDYDTTEGHKAKAGPVTS